MDSRPSAKSAKKTFLLLLGAFAAGAVNGALGTGAGTILYLLYRKATEGRDGVDAKECFCAAMTAVLPVSLLSALTYPDVSAGGTGLLFPLVVPAAAGGLAGAAISEAAPPEILKKAFALTVAFGGTYMLLR